MNFSQSSLKPLRKKNILVTGAAGFVGSHLVRSLLADGCSVVACVRPKSDHARLKGLKGDLTVLPLDLSVFRADDLVGQNIRPDIIFHLGAYGVGIGNNDPDMMTATNVRGTGQMLEFARMIGVHRFIHCGSCFEYPSGQHLKEESPLQPVSIYGASKKAAGELVEKYWRKHNLPCVTLRLFTVFGPGEDRQRLVSAVIHAILKNDPLPLTGGVQTRDFIFIEDVVRAFYAAAVSDNVLGGVFNVATGIETSVKDLVLKVIKLMGVHLVPEFGVLPYRQNEYWHLSGDPSKSEKYLSWRADTSLEEGLRKTITWVSAQKEV